MRYRESIFYNYENFFGKRKSQNETDAESKSFDSGTMPPKFMWLAMVDKLCKELNMTPAQVYEMNYISSLNWLSLYHYQEQLKKNNT